MKNIKQLFYSLILLSFVSTSIFGVEREGKSANRNANLIENSVGKDSLEVKPEKNGFKSSVEKEKVTFFTKLKSKFVAPKEVGKKRGLAIAGFIVSLVGLFVFPLGLGIVAVTFSSIGLARVIKSPDTHRGKGLAIAGLSIGLVDIIYGILLFL